MKVLHLSGAIALLAIASVILTPLSEAQSLPHAVIGYVTDLSGSPAGNATVTLHSQRTGGELTATTNSLGQYQVDLTSLSGGYQTGDTITVRAALGSMEGSSSFSVGIGVVDQCDIVLDTEVSGETPYPGLFQIACVAIILSILFGMAMRRKD